MADVWLVVAPGTREERVVPVAARMHIGRECPGVDELQRILVDDPSVSRDHAEVHVNRGSVYIIDHSTNGTRVNGRRIERAERMALIDGDEVEIGTLLARVRTVDVVATFSDLEQTTIRPDAVERCVVLVGDVVGYTGLNELRGAGEVAAAVDGLFGELRRLVVAGMGTVNNFAGDAILALWELAGDADSVAQALRCARQAHEFVEATAPSLQLRYFDDSPIRVGWAVTVGHIAFSHPSPARVSVHGDAINLAFRLAGIAGRGDVAPVLADLDVAAAAPSTARFGAELELRVKGREAAARVRAVESV